MLRGGPLALTPAPRALLAARIACPHPPRPRSSLTLFTVVSILVQPEAVPAPTQVASERVDALVLAPAVVLGALILVWGDRRALFRGTANSGWSPQFKRSLPDCPARIVPSPGGGGRSMCRVLHGPGVCHSHAYKVCSPPKTRSSLKDRLMLIRTVTTIKIATTY